jgi:ferredoxin
MLTMLNILESLAISLFPPEELTAEIKSFALSHEADAMVRGVKRRYVDFDKCIPYFAESASCGICFAACPWTRPNVRPKLLATMARRMGQVSIDG